MRAAQRQQLTACSSHPAVLRPQFAAARARLARAAAPPARASAASSGGSSSSSSGGGDGVDAEQAMVLLQREGWKVLDVRPPREVDAGRITKPARATVAVPFAPKDDGDPAAFVSAVRAQLPAASSRVLVMDADGGAASRAALAALAESGCYAAVELMRGGYAAWGEVWSPSGKRRPPPGRWVPTGKEALKSASNIPGAAESYEEGGNLATARYARGFKEGEGLPPMSPPPTPPPQ